MMRIAVRPTKIPCATRPRPHFDKKCHRFFTEGSFKSNQQNTRRTNVLSSKDDEEYAYSVAATPLAEVQPQQITRAVDLYLSLFREDTGPQKTYLPYYYLERSLLSYPRWIVPISKKDFHTVLRLTMNNYSKVLIIGNVREWPSWHWASTLFRRRALSPIAILHTQSYWRQEIRSFRTFICCETTTRTQEESRNIVQSNERYIPWQTLPLGELRFARCCALERCI